MNVLVIGRGGREHALLWKLSKSPRIGKLYAATGNGGISRIATCVDIKAENVEDLLAFAREKKIDMTIVGPEVSLNLGIVDLFTEAGLTIFGPTRKGSFIESSKGSAKSFMHKYNIPTTFFASFDNQEEAFTYIEEKGAPLVIKADGLTAGRGAIFAHDEVTAKLAASVMLKDRVFGSAGERVIVEEYLRGTEITVLAFTDGKTIVPMPSVEVNYSSFDRGRGPTTGGMGTCSPSRAAMDMPLADMVRKRVLEPALKGLKKEKLHYKGILYTRMVITDEGPKVVEFNVRFGDPETQTLMPRLKTDLLTILEAIRDEKLHEIDIEWDERQAMCTVIASGGYPMRYETGYKISGLDNIPETDDTFVFHAGTMTKGDGLVTSGGRVLNIVTLGDNRDEMRRRGLLLAEGVQFTNKHFRADIGM
ncbi:MAG: phosphoribosylamine--glycine ligase [Candidatus Wallbacteria bacterium HGW-Wallbacteria-1]|jgi:phosphoribosylamine--glycine ligase|uniref:Phosphoribosylamine--glycine ligase n=1 Tax=Candidatus Wallbacteria bacterium HGW-Wallbacteria-1 TaxID=2013854 RepID=A0A2N1PTD9_9BACT|nr:MAG: phosphoribosylamine--glycine ligase [Candidatus Wallbacteria bacterium HGW-Wallbacteria-1]